MNKHTPTPWRSDTHEDTNGIVIRATTEENGDTYEDIVAAVEGPDILLSLDNAPEAREEEAKANAAFIVKACNNYETLLAAAKKALEFMERVEVTEWFGEGDAETIPQVDEFRQIMSSIEE